MKMDKNKIRERMNRLRNLKTIKRLQRTYTPAIHIQQQQTYSQPTALSTEILETYKTELRKKLLNIDRERFLLH